MRRFLTLAALAAAFAGGGLLAQGGIGPIGNLQGRVDANNALVVTAAAAGATGAATAPIANLPGKVDANNNLLVTVAAGSMTPDTLCLDATNQDTCLIRDGAADTLALRRSTNEQTFRIGPAANYSHLSSSGGSLRVGVNAGAYSHYLTSTTQFLTQAGAGWGLTTMTMVRTAPTIGSGFGTSPTVPSSNGTAAFTVNVGTGGTASAGVITMPTAGTGWACQVENRTGVAANRANQRTLQTATTTTSVSVQNQTISTGAALAWTASDIVQLMCLAY